MHNPPPVPEQVLIVRGLDTPIPEAIPGFFLSCRMTLPEIISTLDAGGVEYFNSLPGDKIALTAGAVGKPFSYREIEEAKASLAALKYWEDFNLVSTKVGEISPNRFLCEDGRVKGRPVRPD